MGPMPETQNAQPPEPADQEQVHIAWIVLLGIWLTFFAMALLCALVQVWPSGIEKTPGSELNDMYLLFWKISISGEVQLLLVVALAGALGAMVHSLRSFYWYVGNQELAKSWFAMYLFLPVVGMVLSVVFYFVFRGGFFSPQANIADTSPFGFAALSSLVGLFSQQAILKLKLVAETVLSEVPPGDDSHPQ